MPRLIALDRKGPNADAPLWHTRPMLPVFNFSNTVDEDEHAQMPLLTFARPRQFGPDIRTPVSRATSPRPTCNSLRSSSARSANPAEITIAEPAPFSALSVRIGITL